MFQHQGIWLPDGEKHFPDWMTRNGEIVDGRGSYQIRKLRASMDHVKQFRVAVDVGAHVGLWAMHLVKRFDFVHAFEPVPEFRACLSKNLPETNQRVGTVFERKKGNHLIYPCALGEVRGNVSMSINPADTGGTHVKGEGDVSMHRLDDFDLQDVDFIKIDCEGYEHHVIAGARETLIRCRPCVIVEQKPHKLGPNFGIKGTPAVDLLRELGAEVRREMGGDYIMTFPGK